LTNHFFRPEQGDLLNLNESVNGEIDSWLRQGKKRVLIFGAGEHTRKLLQRIDLSKLDLVGFADNNSSLWDQNLNGTKICGPHDILDLNPDIILISTAYHEAEIVDQLAAMRLKNVDIVPIYTGRFLNFYSWLETGFYLSQWHDLHLHNQRSRSSDR